MRFFLNRKLAVLSLSTLGLFLTTILIATPSEKQKTSKHEITQEEWLDLMKLPLTEVRSLWLHKFQGSLSQMNWTWRLGFINICFKENISSNFLDIIANHPWCEDVLIQGLENRAVVVRSHSLRKLGKINFNGDLPEKILKSMLDNAKELQKRNLGQRSFIVQNYLYAAKRSKNKNLMQEGKKIVSNNPLYGEYWRNL